MKNFIYIILVIMMTLTSCEMVIDELSGPEILSNVVLYDGVINDTTYITFQSSEYGFPKNNINIRIEFSDPGEFVGSYFIFTNTGFGRDLIFAHAPSFIINHVVDLADSNYFRLENDNWNTDPTYTGQNINCKVIWIRN